MRDKDILICDCNSTEHQFIFLYEEDENNGEKHPMCFVHTHLNKRPFWERVKYGIKYIFGYRCRFGAFDEFILNPDDADKLQKLVDYLRTKDLQ
jgi:hypothetical protein